MKTVRRTARVQASSGNVFADLDFRDSAQRIYKADLARQICMAIAARRLTQAKAAETLGLDQPKVSALRRAPVERPCYRIDLPT